MGDERRGYFAIGIDAAKTPENVGTLMRSASSMGARFAFTIGARYPRTRQDTGKSWRHMPLFEYPDRATFLASLPKDAELVAVECGENVAPRPLPAFRHPERAIYVLGAEDRGLGQEILDKADRLIEIPDCSMCLNVAVTGSIVMYDRRAKESV